ncbi:MAG: twin-arginine translocation signal domain-containing protein [Phycisphaeraceae bacterium]|nr:MAG: twin-arginine translocation signal domain-containing protein [Phycisphaeraceae bacterium]
MTFGISRRRFLTNSAASGVAVAMGANTLGRAEREDPMPPPGEREAPVVPGGAALRWLEDQGRSPFAGVTWGVPWPMGRVASGSPFAVFADDETPVACQSWPLAYWPDGSLKWSAHAIGPIETLAEGARVQPGVEPATPTTPVRVEDEHEQVTISTGPIRCVIARSGDVLIPSVERDGRAAFRNGRLACLNQNAPSDPEEAPSGCSVQPFAGAIDAVEVEQDGPVRAVVKIEGRHTGEDGRAWLPFIVRLYFYAGCDSIRVMHTIIYDGDEDADFIRGLGLQFDVPMDDALFDRHMRFVSAEGGVWGEAVQTVTGLRRDPGEHVRALQIAGQKLPDPASWDENVGGRMHWVPAWNDVTLTQLSADGFEIRKRTKPGCGWIFSDGADRAAGVGYVGGVSGGVAFGLRNFWQSHPTQLDIRNAASDSATVTMWLWSPEAPAMDLRFYHDGLGIEGHAEELKALGITYEDYEPGFGTAHGVARTSEMNLWIAGHTPPNERLIEFARDVMTPPMLACWPQHAVQCNIFGGLFSLPDRSTPVKAALEAGLDRSYEAYFTQREQRRWYGFWNYGDVMHSYDRDRHVWRYDVGGYAWDNSELSPDFWLWYGYLRTGRADIFRFAEALCRHTGEVDVYHLGRFQDLGSRHNVQHWGDSAKQLRISQVAYRRFYYYLTADERTGDLLAEQEDNAMTFLRLDPLRKIREGDYTPNPDAVVVHLGTDWGAVAMATLTAWERTGDDRFRRKLINSMESIGRMPYGYFTDGALMNPKTLEYVHWDEKYGMSHLSAVFGLNEICAELVQLLNVPSFEKAWLDYCQYYNATRAERKEALGVDLRSGILVNGHSRLTAFAAVHRNSEALAHRAWRELLAGDSEQFSPDRFEPVNRLIDAGPESLKPVNETNWMSTNDIGMWGTATIQDLALVSEYLPRDFPDRD